MKLRVLRAVVYPTASYGCESWTFSKKVCNKITAFESKCYRTILNVHWSEHRTNQSIQQELKVKPEELLRFMKKQKLKYFGHTSRHESLEKLFLEGRVEGCKEEWPS